MKVFIAPQDRFTKRELRKRIAKQGLRINQAEKDLENWRLDARETNRCAHSVLFAELITHEHEAKQKEIAQQVQELETLIKRYSEDFVD